LNYEIKESSASNSNINFDKKNVTMKKFVEDDFTNVLKIESNNSHLSKQLDNIDKHSSNSLASSINNLGFNNLDLIAFLNKKADLSNSIIELFLNLKQGSSIAKGLKNLIKKDKKVFIFLRKAIDDMKNRKNLVKNNYYNDVKWNERLFNLNDLEKSNSLDNSKFNSQLQIPQNSFKIYNDLYEEICIEPKQNIAKFNKGSLISLSRLPKWINKTLSNINKFNAMQSKVYPMAILHDDNIFVSAPTGSGKTLIAYFCILKVIKQSSLSLYDERKRMILKVVYLAPMKALIRELNDYFKKLLTFYKLDTLKMISDTFVPLSQVKKTFMIITTPEKLDIITRKSYNEILLNCLKLLIIDELHLLHYLRGNVIERLIARIFVHNSYNNKKIRLLGLSATFPNFIDAAKLLRVNIDRSLFAFDQSFRTIPIKYSIIGIKKTENSNQAMLIEKILLEKTKSIFKKKFQTIIFVHSRKDCIKTAKKIIDNNNIENNTEEIKEITEQEFVNVENKQINDILGKKIGVHNAGLSAKTRILIEDLFYCKKLLFLVSTSTLAWGVNLPAKIVLIKGTSVYDSFLCKWSELNFIEILQMFGRAGRPQFDIHGEGVLLTTSNKVGMYLAFLSNMLNIESTLLHKITDSINTEITTGLIYDEISGINWLSFSFLFVRIKRNPTFYYLKKDLIKSQDGIAILKTKIIKAAVKKLQICGFLLIHSKKFYENTNLGKIASYNDINFLTFFHLSNNLTTMFDEGLFLKTLCLSDELQKIVVRLDEFLDIKMLVDIIPIPYTIEENINILKIFSLAQAYIGRFSFNDSVLASDSKYIQKTMVKICHGLIYLSLSKGNSSVFKLSLKYSKMLALRLWNILHPFRQFSSFPLRLTEALEKYQLSCQKIKKFSHNDIKKLTGISKNISYIKEMANYFPDFKTKVKIYTLTNNLIVLNIQFYSMFNHSSLIHDLKEYFWINITNSSFEEIHFYDIFYFSRDKKIQEISTIISLTNPITPYIFININSHKWLNCSFSVPISISNLVLPALFTSSINIQKKKSKSIKEYKVFHSKNLRNTTYKPNHKESDKLKFLYSTGKNTILEISKGVSKTIISLYLILFYYLESIEAIESKKFCYICERNANTFDVFKNFNNILAKNSKKQPCFSLKTGIILEPYSYDDKDLDKNINIIELNNFYSISKRKNLNHNYLAIIENSLTDCGNLHPFLEEVFSNTFNKKTFTNKFRYVVFCDTFLQYDFVHKWISNKGFNLLFNWEMDYFNTDIILKRLSTHTFNNQCKFLIFNYFTNLNRFPKVRTLNIFYLPNYPSFKFFLYNVLEYLKYDNMINTVSKEYCSHSVKEFLLLQNIIVVDSEIITDNLKYKFSLILSNYVNTIISIFSPRLKFLFKFDSFYLFSEQTKKFEISKIKLNFLNYFVNRIREKTKKLNPSAIYTDNLSKQLIKQYLGKSNLIESDLLKYIDQNIAIKLLNQNQLKIQALLYFFNSTFLYTALLRNPNYYGITNNNRYTISLFFSSIVENILTKLIKSRVIYIDKSNNIIPLHLALIILKSKESYSSIIYLAKNLFKTSTFTDILVLICKAINFKNTQNLFTVDLNIKTSPFASQKTVFHNSISFMLKHFKRNFIANEKLIDYFKLIKNFRELLTICIEIALSFSTLDKLLNLIEINQLFQQATLKAFSRNITQTMSLRNSYIYDYEENKILFKHDNKNIFNKIKRILHIFSNSQSIHIFFTKIGDQKESILNININHNEIGQKSSIFEKNINNKECWLILFESKAKKIIFCRKIHKHYHTRLIALLKEDLPNLQLIYIQNSSIGKDISLVI